MSDCRFGMVPILRWWACQPLNDRVMNELGFAFLRRMTIEPCIPLVNHPGMSQVDHAEVQREVAGTVCIWNLLDSQHGAADGMLPPTAPG